MNKSDCNKCIYGSMCYLRYDNITGEMNYISNCKTFKNKNNLFSLDQVATILLNTFNDTCACNYNCNDEWLPYVCDFQEECPNPPNDSLACWKQFLKHYQKRNQILEDNINGPKNI